MNSTKCVGRLIMAMHVSSASKSCFETVHGLHSHALLGLEDVLHHALGHCISNLCKSCLFVAAQPPSQGAQIALCLLYTLCTRYGNGVLAHAPVDGNLQSTSILEKQGLTPMLRCKFYSKRHHLIVHLNMSRHEANTTDDQNIKLEE